MRKTRVVTSLLTLMALAALPQAAMAQTKVNGVIAGRSGANMMVRTATGTTTVTLNDATKVEEKKGALKLQKSSMAVTSLIPGAGSRYYLVGAQADNKDGSLGMRTGGTGRTGPFDYCDTKGWGTLPGKCVKDFTNPVNGSVLKLMDYNPKSPTYNQYVSISDFRGRVVRLDLSADT